MNRRMNNSPSKSAFCRNGRRVHAFLYAAIAATVWIVVRSFGRRIEDIPAQRAKLLRLHLVRLFPVCSRVVADSTPWDGAIGWCRKGCGGGAVGGSSFYTNPLLGTANPNQAGVWGDTPGGAEWSKRQSHSKSDGIGFEI